MVAFADVPSAIDDHRQDYGVEPICAGLPIAPSTYHAAKARETNPALCSARTRSDEALRVEIQRVWDENRHVYGAKPARLGGAGVWWFNERRLMEPLGYLPPAEYEDAFYRRQEAQATEAALTNSGLRE